MAPASPGPQTICPCSGLSSCRACCPDLCLQATLSPCSFLPGVTPLHSAFPQSWLCHLREPTLEPDLFPRNTCPVPHLPGGESPGPQDARLSPPCCISQTYLFLKSRVIWWLSTRLWWATAWALILALGFPSLCAFDRVTYSLSSQEWSC